MPIARRGDRAADPPRVRGGRRLLWAKADVSQQEFRDLVRQGRAARSAGREGGGEDYRNNPDADFHKFVARMTGLDRKPAKTTNFAKIYGGGVADVRRRRSASCRRKQRAIMAQYDAALPFVKQLSQIDAAEGCSAPASPSSMDGAQRHWNLYAAPGYRQRRRPVRSRRGTASRQRTRSIPGTARCPGAPRPTRRFNALNSGLTRAIHIKNWMLALLPRGHHAAAANA